MCPKYLLPPPMQRNPLWDSLLNSCKQMSPRRFSLGRKRMHGQAVDISSHTCAWLFAMIGGESCSYHCLYSLLMDQSHLLPPVPDMETHWIYHVLCDCTFWVKINPKAIRWNSSQNWTQKSDCQPLASSHTAPGRDKARSVHL